jgi:hypothetical protein
LHRAQFSSFCSREAIRPRDCKARASAGDDHWTI